MTTRFLSDPESGEERWALDSTAGCCTFQLVFEHGKGVVEYDTGCHACVNELNALAVERSYQIRRRDPGCDHK